MMTPYEKLKSLENGHLYLKEGVDFERLEKQAMSSKDLEAAEKLRKAQQKCELREKISRKRNQFMREFAQLLANVKGGLQWSSKID